MKMIGITYHMRDQDATIDNLVMALSADWFFELYDSLCLALTPKQKVILQEECRHIVHQIMGQADVYWAADFSDYRLLETERLLSIAAAQSGLSSE